MLPSKEEQKIASDICDKLALFHRTTKAFLGKTYPIANLYFQKLCEISLTQKMVVLWKYTNRVYGLSYDFNT